MTAHLAAMAALAAILAAFAISRIDPGPGHTCDLPCLVQTAGEEDAYHADYQHGGTLYVYRVTP